MASFSVLTYNLLHSFGASRLLRGRAAAASASWPQERLLRAAELIKRLQPDVACLQEVDDAAQTWLERVLGAEFECAASMRNEGLPPRDGCAAFVRRSRFEVVHTTQFRLRDTIANHCGGTDSARERGTGMAAAFWRELHEKLNVAIALRLRLKDETNLSRGATQADVMVATSHLFWDPRYPDLKLLQAFLLAKELQRLAEDFPLILAGDLNSTPLSEDGGDFSGVYGLLTGGSVHASHPHHPVKLRKGRGILAGVAAEDVPDLHLDLTFRSAYLDAFGVEGPITNASSDFCGCIDYILYRPSIVASASEQQQNCVRSALRLLSAKPLPTEAELRPHIPLPSAEHPSDHLPLLAEFQLARC